MLGQRSAGVVLFLIGVLSASTRSADACSRFCKDPPVRLFPPVAEVPGNLIYFKVLVKEPGPLALTTEKGEPVPASVRRIGTLRRTHRAGSGQRVAVSRRGVRRPCPQIF